MNKVIVKARKILVYKEVHEFSEPAKNRFRHPLYEFPVTERSATHTTPLYSL